MLRTEALRNFILADVVVAVVDWMVGVKEGGCFGRWEFLNQTSSHA